MAKPKLKNIIKHPITVQALVLLLVFLAIWFVGPLIAIAGAVPLGSVLVRLILIAAVLIAWIAVLVIRMIRAKRAGEKLADDLTESANNQRDDEVAEQAVVLSERFREAMEVLRKSGAGGKANSLFHLPWYVIIGPPGSGKTTALVESGLKFKLSERFCGPIIT
ncbi:MAG: hypothetical protein AAGF15_11845 [Pseudomonadota bacterium]